MATRTGYELSLRDYWRILRKKKGTVIFSTLLLAVFSFALAYMNKPVLRYRSTASIKIDKSVTVTGLLVHTISWGREDMETRLRVIKSLPFTA